MASSFSRPCNLSFLLVLLLFSSLGDAFHTPTLTPVRVRLPLLPPTTTTTCQHHNHSLLPSQRSSSSTTIRRRRYLQNHPSPSPPLYASIHNGSTRSRRRRDVSTTRPTAWLKPYIAMLRPQNILPSMLLVMMGAWTATHDLRRILDPIVGVMATVSALVAVGSCVLNDWFDMRVDSINHPERTLAAGHVRPLYALLLGAGCLGLALVLGLHAAAARAGSLLMAHIVRLAVVAVTLYTPVFKPIPFVKNAVVAAVTAASVTLGGLASGAPLQATLAPAGLVFTTIYHREILMDIDDAEGDAQCGIWTLPRLLGKRSALWLAMSLFGLGTGLSARTVVGVVGTRNTTPFGGWATGLSPLPFFLVCVAGVVVCMYDWRVVLRQGFRHEDVSRVIAYSPVAMAVMLFLMGGGGGV